jgi:hypothetical protein
MVTVTTRSGLALASVLTLFFVPAGNFCYSGLVLCLHGGGSANLSDRSLWQPSICRQAMGGYKWPFLTPTHLCFLAQPAT